MAADFLDDKRREIDGRLQELRPLVDEYQRLQAAADALDGVASTHAAQRGAAARPATRSRASKRTTAKASKTSSGTTTTARRRGRPKGSGKRREEALALVTGTPGITVSQIADRMGIKQNYLYRVLTELAAAGLVTKQGRGWHPAPTS